MKWSGMTVAALAAVGGSGQLASAATGTCQLASGAACTGTAPPAVAAPPSMGQYCSMTWPSGGWAFASNADLTGDPCGYIIEHSGAGGTIEHSGMYTLHGINNVIERCSDGRIMLYGGSGQQPLTDAFNDAQGHPGCIFNVSPREFPEFRAPFSLNPLPAGYAHGSGFDFARYPFLSVDMKNDWQIAGGLTQAFIVDKLGQQRDGSPATKLTAGSNGVVLPASTLHVVSTAGFNPGANTLSVATASSGAAILKCTGTTATSFTGCAVSSGSGTLATNGPVVLSWGFINDHQGYDIVMNDGTPIYAMADGVVDMARYRDVTYACGSANGTQAEIYIRHRFSGGKTRYDEYYESYYAHLEWIAVSTGTVVHKGDLLGYSGHSGCTGGTPHLHYQVMRLTNTAARLSYPLVINTSFGKLDDPNSDLGYRHVIDPGGFYAPTAPAFDPWAWRAFTPTLDWGAQSVNLWQSGQEPPLNPHNGWAVTW